MPSARSASTLSLPSACEPAQSHRAAHLRACGCLVRLGCAADSDRPPAQQIITTRHQKARRVAVHRSLPRPCQRAHSSSASRSDAWLSSRKLGGTVSGSPSSLCRALRDSRRIDRFAQRIVMTHRSPCRAASSFPIAAALPPRLGPQAGCFAHRAPLRTAAPAHSASAATADRPPVRARASDTEVNVRLHQSRHHHAARTSTAGTDAARITASRLTQRSNPAINDQEIPDHHRLTAIDGDDRPAAQQPAVCLHHEHPLTGTRSRS